MDGVSELKGGRCGRSLSGSLDFTPPDICFSSPQLCTVSYKASSSRKDTPLLRAQHPSVILKKAQALRQLVAPQSSVVPS